MYIVLKTAKRATINHHDVDGAGKASRTIVPGEVFLQIHNGTIGQGARATNIGNEQAIKMLENMLAQLKDNKKQSYVYENPGFTSDDIPF